MLSWITDGLLILAIKAVAAGHYGLGCDELANAALASQELNGLSVMGQPPVLAR